MAARPPPEERAPGLRASDAERERTVTTLRDGAVHGRLTFEELAQRTELAYEATTGTELEQLVADLPVAARDADVVDAPARKQRRWNIAVLGGCDRKGRWRPAPDSVALAVLGGVDLDLRDAMIDGDELVITAVSILGGIEIVVPEGVEVDLGGFALLGGTEHKPGTAPIRPGTPTVRVRGFALLGGIEVKSKRPAGERRRLREGA
jgi:Domain of unknown function (DUF1707)/Cell wall-active antibiotics response 4TMS YvqF